MTLNLTPYIMEVPVDSMRSVRQAFLHENGSPDRLELCNNLELGGTTPSVGFLRKVKEAVDVPVVCLIRPRTGNFEYNSDEQYIMENDIHVCLENGANGFAIGAITKNGSVNMEMCKKLIGATKGRSVTFHRAFDTCNDLKEGLEQVIALGCERILTSGGCINCFVGAENIKMLIEQANGQVIIVPGGGISESNIQTILNITGAVEYHCSASSSHDWQYSSNIDLASLFGHRSLECDTSKLYEIKKNACAYWNVATL